MTGRHRAGKVAALILGTLALAVGSARPALAFEWDLPGERKFSIHGFYESRLLFVGQSLPANDVTWSSFRHVLSLESELTLFPDGFGPFDSMFAFTRFMISYECIYERACGTFNGVDSYGDDHRDAVRQPASLKERVKNNSPYFAGLLKQTYRPGSFVPAREQLNQSRRYRDCDNPPGVFANPFPLAAFCNLNSRSPLDGPIQGGAGKLNEIRAGTFSPISREALLAATRPFIGESEYARMRGLLLGGQVVARSREGLRRTLLTEAHQFATDDDPDNDALIPGLQQQAADLLGTPETTFDANIPTLLATRPDPNRFEAFAQSLAPSLLVSKWGAGQIRNSILPFLATINTPIVPNGYFATASSLDYVGEYEQGLAENIPSGQIAGTPTTSDSDGVGVFRPATSLRRAVPFFVGPDGLRDTADDLPFVDTNPNAQAMGFRLAAPIAGTAQDRFDEFTSFGLPRFTQTAQVTVPNATPGGADKLVELYAVFNPAVVRINGCVNLGGVFDQVTGVCTRNGEDVTSQITDSRGCTQIAIANRGDASPRNIGINADGQCIQMNTTSAGQGRIQFELLPLYGDLRTRPDSAVAEPLDSTDLQLYGDRGELLPARPRNRNNGLYFQSPGARKIHEQRHDLISNLDLKYSVDELQWNHGASQNEHEFQEGYLEFEMADSQLYARLGKLIVVWGKTELFRNQDRNNPLDIGNGLFTPLEEARIGQWALDLTISPEAFMRIGPVEDLRVELLTIFNSFEPTDLGKCGEGSSIELVCGKSFGAMANGLAGLGVVGERRPYQDYEGIERWDFGARIEGRFDRFTFAISDFWGWDDGFYLDVVQQYERTADFDTGAPLSVNMRDRNRGCKIRTNDEGQAIGPDGVAGNGDDIFASDGQCLLWGAPDEDGVQKLRASDSVAQLHTINQTLFHSICSFTFDPDEGYCALDRLNDPRTFGPIAYILGGLATFGGLVLDGVDSINPNPRSVQTRQSTEFLQRQFQAVNPRGLQDQVSQDLGIVLETKQAGLLGCGPAYASPCSEQQANIWANDPSIAASVTRNPELGVPRFGGIDLMNADASVITQEFTGLKALSPGALVGTKLNQKGTLSYLPGINFSRNGVIENRPAPPGAPTPTTPIETGEYLDLTPSEVIKLGRQGRARFQIDPENPLEADGWIEPMPWTVNKEALEKYGAIVFNSNPNAPYDLTDIYTGDDSSSDPDERGELRWNLIEKDEPVSLLNIDGEYCARWMNQNPAEVFTLFNQGCTGLETISANFERLLIATEIIGFDRVFDPPESLQELGIWGESNTAKQAAGDPISGPDGIYSNNQFVFSTQEMDFSVGEARDAVQLGQAELEVGPAEREAARQWLIDYDPNQQCTRSYCYMRVDNVLTDDDDATSTFPLVINMPIGAFANLMSEPNDPNLPPTDTGFDTRVNLARLQELDRGTLSRLLSGEVVEVQGQLVQLDLTQREGLIGRLDDQNNRGRDLDGDGTSDLDRDRDLVWDGIDDYSPGPVTDDNILCGSGIPGDPLQSGLQYAPYREDENQNSPAFRAAFPNGLPPRSPVFCRGVSGLVGGTSQTLPVRKAGGDGRFGRRDFLWQGGRQVVFNYQKRNVFGFGLDFAEDVTKTSWGIEYSWTARKLFGNNFEYDGLSSSDEMVLSVSVDRPTFFNFLNPNRSFFMNLQFFIRYLPGYEGGPKHNDGMYGSAGDKVTGNIVFTFFTGYFQDRLAPRMSILYSPWESQGAVITGISYRWNDAFSTSIGYTQFFGHVYDQDGAYFPIAQYGSIQDYEGPVLRGVAPVLYRDQADLRIRYTW